MSNVNYDYIENYIRSKLPENNGILKELEEYAKENSVPIVRPEVANFIKVMISIKKPSSILELGTAIGYSSILMYQASGFKSRILTVDRDEKMVSKARSNISKYSYDDNIKVVQGDCLELVQKLDKKYDLIFMDAAKGHYNQLLPYCLNLLNNDGIIIADNVLFRGMVASKELIIRRKITIVKRMKKFLDDISTDKNLVSSILPLGDGVALIYRRSTDE